MIEVLFSMLVLCVGLVALSSLAAQSLNGTARSRYMSLASTYASEKLEDLNHWPTSDPHVCVASGATAGSLTSDIQTASVTCNGLTDTVDYFDDVQIVDTNGAACETTSGTSYTTICHNANGTVTTTTSTVASTANIGAIAFHRRWTIEMDQPVTGIKRITVLVTLENGYMQPPVTFQMTAVRP